jgi:CheY-like chemotaxis protein
MAHTVLIVEDDADVRETLAFIISRRTGHAVETAPDGGQALSLLQSGLRPCLVLLDLWMPEVDGWTFRRAQVADPALRDIPTVVMTAMDEPAPVPGVLAWIHKPIELDQLVELINEVCPLPKASSG